MSEVAVHLRGDSNDSYFSEILLYWIGEVEQDFGKWLPNCSTLNSFISQIRCTDLTWAVGTGKIEQDFGAIHLRRDSSEKGFSPK